MATKKPAISEDPNAAYMRVQQQLGQHADNLDLVLQADQITRAKYKQWGLDDFGRLKPAPGSAAAGGVQGMANPSVLAPTMPPQARPPETPQPIGARLPVGNAVEGSPVPGLYESVHTTPTMNDPSIVRGAPSRYTLRGGPAPAGTPGAGPPAPNRAMREYANEPLPTAPLPLGTPAENPFTPAPVLAPPARNPQQIPRNYASSQPSLGTGKRIPLGTPAENPFTPAPLTPLGTPDENPFVAAPPLGTPDENPFTPAPYGRGDLAAKLPPNPYVHDTRSGAPVPGWAQAQSSPLDMMSRLFPGAAAVVGNARRSIGETWDSATQRAIWNAPPNQPRVGTRPIPKQKLRERVLAD